MSHRFTLTKEDPLDLFLLKQGKLYQQTEQDIKAAMMTLQDKRRIMKDGSVMCYINRFIPGHYYHITHHVTDQLQWVVDEEELTIIHQSLERAAKTHHIDVLVWNIMSNHVHLIVRTKKNSHVPQFMQAFLGGAIQRINKKRLADALDADPDLLVEPAKVHFEGRYTAILILDLEYLISSILYVLTNAEKAGIPDHLGKRSRHNWKEFKKAYPRDNHLVPGDITFAEAMVGIEKAYIKRRNYWIRKRGVHSAQQILPSLRRRRMQSQMDAAMDEVIADLEFATPARIRKRRLYDPEWERW